MKFHCEEHGDLTLNEVHYPNREDLFTCIACGRVVQTVESHPCPCCGGKIWECDCGIVGDGEWWNATPGATLGDWWSCEVHEVNSYEAKDKVTA